MLDGVRVRVPSLLMLKNCNIFSEWLFKVIPLLNIKYLKNEIVIVVSYKNVFKVIYFLKNSLLVQCGCLISISGVDYPDKKNRFEVSYELLSIRYNFRIRVKTYIDEVKRLESITKIYKGADWWEREVWDLYGVYFKDHSDLRRILTDYAFQGHPMRKDFPLSGYYELVYGEKLKRVINLPLELTQEMRYFTFRQSINSVKLELSEVKDINVKRS